MTGNVLDERGNLVDGEHGEKGKDYSCVYCGVCMRWRECHHRRSHFYAFGGPHRSKACAELEKEKMFIRHPSKLNKRLFFRRLFAQPEAENGDSAKKKSRSTETTAQEKAPSSLRHLLVCGLHKMSPETPIEGGQLSDILLTYRGYGQYLKDGESLNQRVLLLRPNCAKDGRIRFEAFWGRGSMQCRAFFELIVNDPEEYDRIGDMLFSEKKVVYGKTIYKKTRYREVLVAGWWQNVDKQQCLYRCGYCQKGGKICIGMQESDYLGREENQIFISDLPENMVEM